MQRAVRSSNLQFFLAVGHDYVVDSFMGSGRDEGVTEFECYLMQVKEN